MSGTSPRASSGTQHVDGAGGEVLDQLAAYRCRGDDIARGDDPFDLAADVGGVPADRRAPSRVSTRSATASRSSRPIGVPGCRSTGALVGCG